MKDYFDKIKHNYRTNVGTKKTLILFFDGKGVTKNPNINLLDLSEGGVTRTLAITAREFCNRWCCSAIVGADEMIFIINNTNRFINKYRKATDDIACLTGQEIFLYFNSIYKGKDKIFFHGKVFSINNDEIGSYIKYKAYMIQNVMTQYFLKKNRYDYRKKKLEEMLNISNNIEEYNKLSILEKSGLFIIFNKFYDLMNYAKHGLLIECDNIIKNDKNLSPKRKIIKITPKKEDIKNNFKSLDSKEKHINNLETQQKQEEQNVSQKFQSGNIYKKGKTNFADLLKQAQEEFENNNAQVKHKLKNKKNNNTHERYTDEMFRSLLAQALLREENE